MLFTNDPRHDFARLDRHRLIDDAALLRVVAHLDVTRQRKILAERMADEAVVGQQAPQIRMPVEDDPVKIERFLINEG